MTTPKTTLAASAEYDEQRTRGSSVCSDLSLSSSTSSLHSYKGFLLRILQCGIMVMLDSGLRRINGTCCREVRNWRRVVSLPPAYVVRREGNVFSVCLSTRGGAVPPVLSGGGVPWGYPSPDKTMYSRYAAGGAPLSVT